MVIYVTHLRSELIEFRNCETLVCVYRFNEKEKEREKTRETERHTQRDSLIEHGAT